LAARRMPFPRGNNHHEKIDKPRHLNAWEIAGTFKDLRLG
jgi:hypothetical protein